jgi:hypothetical protein
MLLQQHKRILLNGLACALVLCLSACATGEPRILIVGDSWAQGTYGFESATRVLEAEGFGHVGVIGEKTALGGTRADQWASNHRDKLDILTRELERHPSVDIVHLIIGGNDFLKFAMEHDLTQTPKEELDALFDRICGDIRILVEHILAVRPDIRVVLCDYDYLGPALINRAYDLGIETTDPLVFNEILVALGRKRLALARSLDRLEYVQNFGLLQHLHGSPPDIAPGSVPAPGGPPDFDPYPGGDPRFTNSEAVMPDGVHVMPENYEDYFRNAFNQYYREWLSRPSAKSGGEAAAEPDPVPGRAQSEGERS